MKVLVTGATGYLGRTLIPVLHDAGYTIRALVRQSGDLSFLSGLRNVEIFYGDITKEETLEGIEKDIEYVYHLAGHISHLKDDQTCFDVNLLGTLNLLKRFVGSGLKKFLFTTSSAALGVIRKKTVTETNFAPPVTAYGMSKYNAELAIKEFAEKHAISYVIVRFTHIYGPGEVRDLYKIIKMIKKGIFPQVGLFPNLFPAVYLDDAVRGLMLAMGKGRPGETYILTDETSQDTRTIRRLVRKYLGIREKWYPVLPKYPTLLMFSVLDWISQTTGVKFPATKKNIQFITAGRNFSIDKARRELGYEPQVSLEEGVKKTIEYYLQEGLI